MHPGANAPSIQPTLVNTAQDGSLVTDSHIIASGTDSQHRAVLQLVKQNLTDFEDFGRVAFQMRPFETAGGTQNRTVAVLNREQAMLLMTYMRNTEIVRGFKKNLIRAFVDMEKQLSAPALSGKQLMAAALLEAQSTMRELEVTNQQQAEQLAAAAPAVEYHDTYVTDEDYLYFSDVASTLGIQETELRELLISHKWIYAEAYTRWSEKKNRKETRRRYSEYAHKKPYFHRAKNHKVPRFMGTVMHTLMITPAGATAIKRAVEKWLRPDQSELDLGGRNAA